MPLRSTESLYLLKYIITDIDAINRTDIKIIKCSKSISVIFMKKYGCQIDFCEVLTLFQRVIQYGGFEGFEISM